MSIQDVKHTMKHWADSLFPTRETSQTVQTLLNGGNDERNVYELQPQSPFEYTELLVNNSVRFLCKDGGVRNGIIVAIFPATAGNTGVLRIFDRRRNKLYTIPDSEVQLMKKRTD